MVIALWMSREASDWRETWGVSGYEAEHGGPLSAREELGRHVQEIRTLSGILGLLSWDQQVHMPPGGAQARGAQLALLSEAVHARVSDGRMEGWLTELAGSQDPILAGGVRNLRRRYDRACRIPTLSLIHI